ncbi:InlB B-repeat-containing protein [Parabacteroides sp. APC149_11_2_Y6]
MRKLISLMLLMMVIVVGCKKDDLVISEYIVTFNTQGGSNIDALKVVEGQKVTKPQDPTKENYIFSGWYKEAACLTVWDFEKETVMSNVTLYAKWVEAAQACVVTFDAQGGSEVAPLTVNKGEKLVKPTDPTKEDCSFLGWYKDAAYTSVWEFSSDVVNEDITLYARWSNPGEAVYTVTFDTDGGNEIEAASVKGNEKAIKPADPVKLGFDFEGWYSDPGKQTVYDFETPVTGDMTLYAKWVKAEIALIEFNDAELAGTGIVWDETTKTLDITEATGSAALSFNVVGIVTLEKDVQAKFDTQAKSIGGTNDILAVGEAVGNKIGMVMNVPEQTIKVPLDVYVRVYDAGNPDVFEEIIITSRPDYNGTGIQPVMMKTTDDKLVFWAPVNVDATQMPTSLADAGDDSNPKDITESCGKLFQWGRKFGFAATNDATKTDTDKFDGKTDPLGFPKGQGALAEMSKWDGKFIMSSSSAPNTQGNWLLFNTDGSDNPAAADMVDGEWYQKLWNKGTEDAPVKTEYDPCPAGWRVPTFSEWHAIGANVSSITKEWDDANKLMSIPGADAEGKQKLILPVTGRRFDTNGTSNNQGSYGYYWSSSVSSGNVFVRCVLFNSAALTANVYNRAYGLSVRCVQE